jgi:dTMP kinase
VADALLQLDVDLVVTREPGGTTLGEQIREWILGGHHEDLAPETEALLMFAARAQHLTEVIRPALAAGRWVLCDRFTDATLAYQGGGRSVSIEFLRRLESDVQRELRPDLTLLLDAPVEVGFGRIAGRELDHFERAGLAFLERVRKSYLEIAREEPARVSVVDATRSPETVAADMVDRIRAFADAYRMRTDTDA